jgi:Transcriptional regulators
MTLGTLTAIHERQLKIPHVVAVVGFDDLAWASALDPPLTTIGQPIREEGSLAADLLFQRIADPSAETRVVTIQPSLVVRRSCGVHPSTPIGARPCPGDRPAERLMGESSGDVFTQQQVGDGSGD